jgi:hypothetical protein
LYTYVCTPEKTEQDNTKWNIQNEIAGRIGQAEQDRQNGQAEQDCQDRTFNNVRTGLPGQDDQDRTARTELPGEDCQVMVIRAGLRMTGQLG